MFGIGWKLCFSSAIRGRDCQRNYNFLIVVRLFQVGTQFRKKAIFFLSWCVSKENFEFSVCLNAVLPQTFISGQTHQTLKSREKFYNMPKLFCQDFGYAPEEFMGYTERKSPLWALHEQAAASLLSIYSNNLMDMCPYCVLFIRAQGLFMANTL